MLKHIFQILIIPATVLIYILMQFVIFLVGFLSFTLADMPCADINCQTCYQNYDDYNQTCISCKPMWTLSGTSCQRPACNIPYCNSCDNTNQYCTGCAQPYTLGASSCELQQYVIVLPILFIVVVCFLTCIAYCCSRCRSRRRQQNFALQLRNNRLSSPSRYRSDTVIAESNVEIKTDYVNHQYDQEKDNCTICLQNGCNMITKCNHYFHAQCFYAWTRKCKTCPMCSNTDVRVVKVIQCYGCRRRFRQYDMQAPKILKTIVEQIKKQCDLCQIIVFEEQQQNNKAISQQRKDSQGPNQIRG